MSRLLFAVAVFIAVTPDIAAQKKTDPSNCTPGVQINRDHPKAAALQAALEKHTKTDLPGLSVAIYTPADGWWAGAGGYAQLETKSPMTICHLQYLQSVSKSYMAATILLLHERKKIDLNAPITRYLPQKHRNAIRNADSITVRMLLNHTSGIAEYIFHPSYTAEVVLHPTKVLDMDWAVQLLKDEEPQYPPGAEYRYTNTNYLLLAMIADGITGNHGKFIRDNIFAPLEMKHSYYHPETGRMDHTDLPDSYWDILSVGRPANITPMQRANVAPLKGDDGVVSTTTDAVKFLRGLMEGHLLKDSSLKMMQQWVTNKEGKPVYGLGLIHFVHEGKIAYGHGGGGLGAGCMLAYFPEQNLYFFIATNTGVVIDGRGGSKADAAKNEILEILLK